MDPPEVLYPAVDKGGIDNLKEKCAGVITHGGSCRTRVYKLRGGGNVVGGPDEAGGRGRVCVCVRVCKVPEVYPIK